MSSCICHVGNQHDTREHQTSANDRAQNNHSHGGGRPYNTQLNLFRVPPPSGQCLAREERSNVHGWPPRSKTAIHSSPFIMFEAPLHEGRGRHMSLLQKQRHSQTENTVMHRRRCKLRFRSRQQATSHQTSQLAISMPRQIWPDVAPPQ